MDLDGTFDAYPEEVLSSEEQMRFALESIVRWTTLKGRKLDHVQRLDAIALVATTALNGS